MRRKFCFAFNFVLLVALLLPLASLAAPVGKFLMVQGEVDLLKQGKLPAVPAKINDGVEPGDVVRTRAKAKAQVLFIDDTTLTLAPESRVAVADYLYDGRSRRATLKVFRGLVHTAVKKIIELREPEFIMQTNTAAVGVRGTDWFTLLTPNSSRIFLILGLLNVGSIDPAILEFVEMKAMEWTEVFFRMPPRLPQKITPEMLQMLNRLMDTGLPPDAFIGPAPEIGKEPPQFRLPGDPERGLPLYVPPIYQRERGGSPGER
jgi:hypothetical protein